MSNLHFKVTADIADFNKKIDDIKKRVKDSSREVARTSTQIDTAIKRASIALGGLFTAQMARQVVNDIQRVRGEFQQLEIAFSVMLGSKAKADQLMAQAVKTASETPFDLNQVASGYKQLMAYGIELEKLDKTLVMLGDVASGVGAPLNDIVYLFGTLNASGRVATMDIRQFAGRGIPIYEELSRVMGVSKDQIDELASAGRIGFADIEKAFQNMTGAGGKFENLMRAQSDSLVGLKANLDDAVDLMRNEMGKSLEGVFEGSLKAQIKLVENYKAIGNEVLGLAVAYGSYRAVLMAVTAVQKLNMVILRQAVLEKRLAAAASIQLSNAEAIATARTKLLAVAKTNLITVIKNTTKALMANPYMLVATAVAGLTYGIYKLVTAESAHEAGIRSAQEAHQKHISALEDESRNVEQLISRLKDETVARGKRQEALDYLQNEYKHIFKNLDIESAKYIDMTKALAGVNQQLEIKAKLQMQEDVNSAKQLKQNISNAKGWSERWKAEKEATEFLGLNFWGRAKAEFLGTFDDALDARINETQALIDKQEEVEKKSANIAPIKNKSYWEKQKEQNTATLEALPLTAKGSKEWEEAKKKIDEATRALEGWNISAKSTSKAEPKEVVKKDESLFPALTQKNIDDIFNKVREFNKNRIDENNKALKEQQQAENDARLEYLIQWGNIEQKKNALINKYRQEAQKAQTRGEKDSLFKQLQSDLKDLSMQGATQGVLSKMFDDVTRLSSETLQTILDQASRIDISLFSPTDAKSFQDAVKQITAELEGRNPFLAIRNSWENFIEAVKGGDKDGIKSAVDALEAGVSGAVAYLDEVGGAVGDIFSAFGNDTVGEAISGITDIVGGVGQAGVGVAKLASGDIIGGVKDLAQGVAQVVTNITKMHDNKKEKQIEALQGRIDTLTDRYTKLSKEIEKAYSSDASNLIEQNNEILKQKQILLRQQIAEEKAKKKADQERIKEWEQEYNDINDQIADNKEKAIDAIIGSDLKSAIDDFASAYVDAWAQGEDKIKSVKDTVKSMIKSTIVEMMKADFKTPVENLRKKIAEYLQDGIISDVEQKELDAFIENAAKDIDDKYSWADKYVKGDQEQGSATYGAYEKITQDQADRIDGRLTAIQMTSKMTADNTLNIKNTTVEMLKLSVIQTEHLEKIKNNTALVKQTNEKLDKIISNTSKL